MKIHFLLDSRKSLIVWLRMFLSAGFSVVRANFGHLRVFVWNLSPFVILQWGFWTRIFHSKLALAVIQVCNQLLRRVTCRNVFYEKWGFHHTGKFCRCKDNLIMSPNTLSCVRRAVKGNLSSKWIGIRFRFVAGQQLWCSPRADI